MSKTTQPLRFAALIRVSTEKQEKQGESLRTQRTDNTNAAQQLGGRVVKWYGGQEHATPGHEKKEMDRLLHDAQNRPPFDALIVSHADRWSRDNSKSRAGLDIFKKQGIRFFIGTSEQDLFNPDRRLFLGMSAEIGQYFAETQKKKSLENRIHRAKRGFPTCGKLPFGRTFDREAEQWGVDETARVMVEDIAKRYLAGERMPDLAEEYDINHSQLHKVLNHRCGVTWDQRFDCDDLNIHEVVTIAIPRLLPDSTIKAIRRRAKANRTYQHGQPTSPYLLSGMVFCGHCNYSMSGQTNHGNRRYYRHARHRSTECGLHPRPWIRCDELEDIVMRHLFYTFGNEKAVQRAIEEATPNREKIKESQQRQERIEELRDKVKAARDRILRLVSKGSITESQAEGELDKLNQKEAKYQADLDLLYDSLANVPTADSIKAVSKQVADKFKKSRRAPTAALKRAIAHSIDQDYDGMTWEDKRALVREIFAGTAPDGRPNGIYLEAIDGQTNHRHKRWRFTLHGRVIEGDQLVTQSALYSRARGLRERRSFG